MKAMRVFSAMRRGTWAAFALLASLVALAGCGSSSGAIGPQPSPPAAAPDGPTVTVRGTITFDRIPFGATAGDGLDPDNPVVSPAREVVVEAIDANNRSTVLASTVTDASGAYALVVPAERNLFIRAKAQMLKTDAAPTWDFRVRNNVNGNRLYALDGAAFDSGRQDSTRNLHAATGWDGSRYAAARAAAPFAILDTVYQAKALILAAQPTAEFPPLSLFWSPENRPLAPFCPREGAVISSIYITFGDPPFDVDQCAQPSPGVDGIYLLGAFEGDTDEFDQHVIAHEFGHYVEDVFARSDSLGGDHAIGDRLDLRVAFSEGWGNGFAAMVLDDPVYRDSFSGFDRDFRRDVRDGEPSAPGWYSEASVHRILWTAFDDDPTTGGLNLGFGPIFSALTSPRHRQTDAFASIYTFIDALNVASPGTARAVNALAAQEQIFGRDPFGADETNEPFADLPLLPVYTLFDFSSTTPVTLCTAARDNKVYNKAGNRRFLLLRVPQALVATISVLGPAAPAAPADPDILLWRRGVLIDAAETENSTSEQLQRLLEPGTYIAEIYDISHVQADLPGGPRGDTCMTVSVSGVSAS